MSGRLLCICQQHTSERRPRLGFTKKRGYKQGNRYDKTDKFYPCGHNVVFDLNFLNNLFQTNGQKYGTGAYQNWRAIDTRVMANIAAFDGKLDVKDVKLETLCKHFGIEIQAHDALSDIRATRELFFKLRGLK